MKIFQQTIPAAIALLLSSLGGVVSQPAAALTPAEARGIGIGVAALTCAIAKGCEVQPTHYHHGGYYGNYRRRFYRPPVYRQPVFVPVPVVPRYPRNVYVPVPVPVAPRYPRNVHGYSYSGRRDISQIVNQIYLQELGRSADPEGLYTYQDRFDNGWSIDDIRRDIANSNEARSRYYRR